MRWPYPTRRNSRSECEKLMEKLTVVARAKVNLALDVLGRREDGYHEIDTIMQSIDLYDLVTLEDIPVHEVDTCEAGGKKDTKGDIGTKGDIIVCDGQLIERDIGVAEILSHEVITERPEDNLAFKAACALRKACGLGGPGGRQQALRRQGDEGPHLRLDRLDPLEAGAGDLLGARLAAGQQLAQLVGGQVAEGCHPSASTIFGTLK